MPARNSCQRIRVRTSRFAKACPVAHCELGNRKAMLDRAFRECIASSSVSKEWVLSWTRRMVIRNAISLLIDPGSQSFVNTNDDADNELIAFSPDDSLSAIATPESILDLPEFERLFLSFVFSSAIRYMIAHCS